MARLPRLVAAGLPLHLIQRGNNRTTTFSAAADYRRYAAVLFQASRRYGCAIHAYVLMTNHVHLLLTPSDELGPGRMMQALGRVYVRYFNMHHGRTGTLWEGRYRSTIVDSERYLLTCSRYIELNPVRAGMVAHPREYSWSSYQRNAHGKNDRLITPHPIYQDLDADSVSRQEAYRGFFENQLDPSAIDAIRRATNRGTALGGTRFHKHVEGILRRPLKQLRSWR